MQYREKNGLKLSALSLGTVQLGMSYGIANQHGKPEEEESFSIITEALRGGVCSFDTAHAYGDSERLLGRYFSTVQEKPFIVTKMSLPISPSTGSEQVARLMIQKVEASLKDLQLPKIPMMMLHNSDVLSFHSAVIASTFRQLKNEGLVERVGVSLGANVYEQQEANVWKYVEDDIYEAVQVPVNIFDHRLLCSGALRRMQDAGKVVFARSVFLQGLLFLEPEQVPNQLAIVREPLRKLHLLSKDEGLSLAQMAISFVRDLEEVDSLVIGAETAQQVRQHLQWLKGPALPDNVRTKLKTITMDLPESILDPAKW